MTALARAIDGQPLVWRATFSELARWWRWRAERRWLVIPREDHRLEIQFDEWDTEYAFALEIHRGRFHCSMPVTGPADVAGARRPGLRAAARHRRRMLDPPDDRPRAP